MQRCKCGGAACKGANVRYSAQAETGNRMIGWGAYDRSNLSGFRSPFELKYSRHLPPGAATRHLRMVKQQLCRDAVPTLPKPRQLGQHAVLPRPR